MKVQWGVTSGTEVEFLAAAGAGWKPIKGQVCWETDKERLTIGDGVTLWGPLKHYSLGAISGMSEASAIEKFIQKGFVAAFTVTGGAPKLTQTVVATSASEAKWKSEAEAITGTVVGGICTLSAATHAGKVVEITSASEVKVKVENTAGFEAGMFVGLWQGGAGQLALEGVGVTLKTSAATTKTRTLYSELGIRFRTNADAVVVGDQQ